MRADRHLHPHARAIAMGQLVVTAALIVASALVANVAGASDAAAVQGAGKSTIAQSTIGRSTIGRTWSIAEPDALAEIEAKASRLPPNMAEKFGPRAKWSAMRSAALSVASATRIRSVIPFYTLDTEIRLPDGTLLYPKGFTFNPLVYVALPQRLVVVHSRDLAWAMTSARPSDFILVTADSSSGTSGAGVDAIDLSEKTGRAIYILEERVKERLGLTVAPVIITQKGQKLELSEFRLGRPAKKKAIP